MWGARTPHRREAWVLGVVRRGADDQLWHSVCFIWSLFDWRPGSFCWAAQLRRRTSSCSCCVTRSPCYAGCEPSRIWTGATAHARGVDPGAPEHAAQGAGSSRRARLYAGIAVWSHAAGTYPRVGGRPPVSAEIVSLGPGETPSRSVRTLVARGRSRRHRESSTRWRRRSGSPSRRCGTRSSLRRLEAVALRTGRGDRGATASPRTSVSADSAPTNGSCPARGHRTDQALGTHRCFPRAGRGPRRSRSRCRRAVDYPSTPNALRPTTGHGRGSPPRCRGRARRHGQRR
ncbi:MAG: hypothetical protein V7646_3916 [Pseudonocardia sp.]